VLCCFVFQHQNKNKKKKRTNNSILCVLSVERREGKEECVFVCWLKDEKNTTIQIQKRKRK
jgi:hypothetical protein